MNDIILPPGGATPPSTADLRHAHLRRICLLDYSLHIGGLLLSAGVFSVVALFLNYLKRSEAHDTIFESHMNWMIATFWWTIFWVSILFIPTLLVALFTVGLLAWLFVLPALWFFYRMVRGLLRLLDNLPAPNL